MKKFMALLEKRWFAYTFALCVAVALYLLLSNIGIINTTLLSLYNIFKPIITGLILAYLLNPIVVFFEKQIGKTIKSEATSYIAAVVITLLLFVCIVAFLILLVLPSIITSVSGIVSNFPVYQRNVNDILAWIEKTIENVDTSTIQKYVDNAVSITAKFLQTHVGSIVSASINFGGFVFNAVLGFILTIYFLAGKKGILAGISRLRHAAVTEEVYKRQSVFLERCHYILIKYIGADILDGVIVGVLNAIVMLIFGMPYIPLVSVVVAVANLAPTFGPIAGCVIGALVLVFHSPITALIFVGITIVIQTFDGYILKPKLFGNLLGVPAVWILITIILGGNMFGVIGIVLAIPFAAIFSFVYSESIIPFLEARKKEKK